MSINYTHCLRRQFTENILTYLLKGNSVNVVVPKVAEDANRFVKDIQQCELPETRVLVTNMRSCRGSYQQFLLDLWQQYQQQPLQEVLDLYQILWNLEQAKKKFIIVLNHLDAMCADDVDVQFDQDFYIHLNSLKNYRHVALLIITKGTSYHGMSFNIGGEFKTSKLDIQEVEDLPALTGDEVRYELTSRHPKLSGVHISHLMAQIQQGASYDYGLLDYLSRQLNHSTQSWDDMSRFIRQLKSWYKQYKRLQSKQGEYHAQKIVGAADKISSIFKVKTLFKNLFKKMFLVLKVVLADPILALIELFKEWLNKKKR
jgi:hypothetical protein